MRQNSTVAKLTLASLLLASVVCGQNELKERTLRFPNTVKHEMEKSYFKGVFNDAKYNPYKRSDKKRPQSLPEEELDLDILASQLSWHHVDLLTGAQTEWELDPQDVEAVLEVGKKLGTEEAIGLAAPDGQKCQGDECEGKQDARRLMIFPPDNRVEVAIANWSPPRHVGKLLSSGGGCSATLVGPRHILTAGHCIHEGDGGDWFSNFEFLPGLTSSNKSPPSFRGVAMWSLRGWTRDGDSSYDIGMVKLDRETNLGWVSFGYHGGMSESWDMYSKGYPGDKPWGTQWSTWGYPSDVNGLDIEFNTLDTVSGQSGSPIYKYQSGTPVIYGVLFGSVWWEFLWWSDEWNQFTRITSGRFSSMCDWINDARLGC